METIASDMRWIHPTVIFSVPRIYEAAYKRVGLRMNHVNRWSRALFDRGLAAGRDRLRVGAVKPGWRAALVLGLVDRFVFARVRAGLGGKLRVAISGGAPLAPEIAEFFHIVGIKILEGYGLTETSTVSHVNRPDHFRLGTVGLPLDGTLCRIAADGEILLRGPHIFKGYYRDIITTEEASTPRVGFIPETSVLSTKRGSCGSRSVRRT